MANTLGPRGFVPSRYRNGSDFSGMVNMYHIPASDTNIYGPGDVVKSSPNADVNGISDVTKVNNGTDVVRGVIAGVVIGNANGTSLVGYTLDLVSQAIPANKTRDYYVMVFDDPAIIYELQDDGVNVLTATSVNKNATFTVANPSFPQQNSATVLNTASVATTSSLNLRIMGLAQKPNNSFGQYATWLVAFNQHEYFGNTSGI